MEELCESQVVVVRHKENIEIENREFYSLLDYRYPCGVSLLVLLHVYSFRSTSVLTPRRSWSETR